MVCDMVFTSTAHLCLLWHFLVLSLPASAFMVCHVAHREGHQAGASHSLPGVRGHILT